MGCVEDIGLIERLYILHGIRRDIALYRGSIWDL